MKRARTPQARRQSRQARVRARVSGTAERPRLNVFRSNAEMFVQLIDDNRGVTLASAHSKNVKSEDRKVEGMAGKTAVAFVLGQRVAEAAKGLGITTVVFDRAGFRYQGRVKAVAEGARAAGLNF